MTQRKTPLIEKAKLWLLSAGLGLMGTLGGFIIKDIWTMHDDVLIIKERVLNHDKDIQEMKAKLSQRFK